MNTLSNTSNLHEDNIHKFKQGIYYPTLRLKKYRLQLKGCNWIKKSNEMLPALTGLYLRSSAFDVWLTGIRICDADEWNPKPLHYLDFASANERIKRRVDRLGFHTS